MPTPDDLPERSPSNDATRLLLRSAEGDEDAARLLMPLVFEELRAAARRQLAGERADHTLSATALVHEAYLKIAGPREVPWSGRGHYYAAAAEAMRRIVVDHARARVAQKRMGPDARRAALDLTSLPDLSSEGESAGFLILHEAIERLGEVDAEAAEVVRMRYFAGLSVEETATALGRSDSTVKRAWIFARGWLKEAIESERV